MSYLDQAYRMLWEWIAGYSENAATLFAVPLFALATLVITVVLIRRLMPFTIKVFGVPTLIVTIAIIGTVSLCLQLGVARLWRLFEAQPPSFVYAAGDLTVAALSRTQRIRPGLAATLYRLETFSMVLLLIVVGILLWRWNVGYCPRTGDTSCTSPLSDTYSALAEFMASSGS
jgi:hypothetical protein